VRCDVWIEDGRDVLTCMIAVASCGCRAKVKGLPSAERNESDSHILRVAARIGYGVRRIPCFDVITARIDELGAHLHGVQPLANGCRGLKDPIDADSNRYYPHGVPCRNTTKTVTPSRTTDDPSLYDS
jgi:hypothetical protein